ncbi:hypothetical protein Bca101_070990 [Brassica carinata]
MVKKTKGKSDAERQEPERQESSLRGKALASEQAGSGTQRTSRQQTVAAKKAKEQEKRAGKSIAVATDEESGDETSESVATDLDQLQSTCSSYVIISSGFLIIPYCRFITVKTVFTNFAARRLHQNEFGLAEVVYMMRSAEYQATKRCNNVQLAEETVADRQARDLERVRICNQNTAEIFIDDEDL